MKDKQIVVNKIHNVKSLQKLKQKYQVHQSLKMPTHLINMIDGTYPFGESRQQNNANRVLIKQSIPKQNSSMTEILRTAKLAKKLSQNKIFIKLESVLEEDQNISLIYEYIPIKMAKYIKAMDQKFLKQYRNQMYTIAEILADNRIVTSIEIQNMGLNEKYEPKYFLGVNFVQKKQVNIHQLKNDYIEEIKRIFSPYLTSEALAVQKKPTKNLVKPSNWMNDTQQIQNVSSYRDSNNNLIKTRKHESIYYQLSKDKQIKKRKQSYISSVSNLRLNNLYRRINQIQLQVCNTKGLNNNKNGFKFSIEGREFTSKSSYDNAKMMMQGQKIKGLTNNTRNSSNNVNSITSGNGFVKYPGYENQEQYTQQMSQLQEYQKSIRSNRPNRYAIKNNLQMSAHQKPQQKKPYKKFSTQFPTLSDFQQPLMALTNALRISANGLDKKERKVNKKIQLFKEREYSEMKSVSGNTNYMRDFMSVLEEETSTNERTSKHNENESQSSMAKLPALRMQSQQSIEQHFMPQKSMHLQRKLPLASSSQNALTTYSHNIISTPQNQNTETAQNQSKKLKTKPSIQQNINIHNRVKGVIQNSKKLIQKLKQKAKKNS